MPHEFVLEALSPLSARTNPMFGCLAVYVGEKIVLILRDKREGTADNGVWLATTADAPRELAPRISEHAVDPDFRGGR